MNAAFLLVTTSWLAAAEQAPPAGTTPPPASTTRPAPTQTTPTQTTPAPGTPSAGGAPRVPPPSGYSGGPGYMGGTGYWGGTGYGGGCGSCCDVSCGEECCKPRLCDRLRALCHRRRDCCETSCCETSSCDTGHWSVGSAGYNGDCCESGGGHRLFGKLRGKFNRGHGDCCETDCCASSCGGCGSYGGYGAGFGGPAPALPGGSMQKTEPIAPPKDAKPMPSEPAKKSSQLDYSTPRLQPTPRTGLTLTPESNNPF